MAPPVKLRKSDIGHLRLQNQLIVGSILRQPEQVVRWMLAMQAQDFPGAKWSVGVRCSGATHATVSDALATGKIVRSWPMRGTLHLTAADDLHWMLALTTPRLLRGAATRRANLQLDEKSLERARSIALAALGGGHVLTREQLLAEIDRRGVSTEGQRGYHILWHLSQTGTLCFGPPQASDQTFVLLDEWVKKPRRLEREEALAELARRYFQSHGPATMKDFAGWTKLTAADLKLGLAGARAALIELTVDDLTHWMARESEPLLSTSASGLADHLVLLPGFDEYILGYQDRSAVLRDEHRERIVPGANGVFMPTVVLGGAVVGTWRRVVRAKHTTVSITPFCQLPPASRAALERAADAYGRFADLSIRLEAAEGSTAGRGPKALKRGKVDAEGVRSAAPTRERVRKG